MKYLPILLILTACSYTHPIGVIGSKRLTKIQLGSITGPAQTVIAVEDTNTHEVTFMSPIGGNGLLPSLTAAGGLIGGLYLHGANRKGDNTTVSQSSSVDTDVTAAAAASSAANTTVHGPVINDPPPAPPIGTRPPFGPPPWHKFGGK